MASSRDEITLQLSMSDALQVFRTECIRMQQFQMNASEMSAADHKRWLHSSAMRLQQLLEHFRKIVSSATAKKHSEHQRLQAAIGYRKAMLDFVALCQKIPENLYPSVNDQLNNEMDDVKVDQIETGMQPQASIVESILPILQPPVLNINSLSRITREMLLYSQVHVEAEKCPSVRSVTAAVCTPDAKSLPPVSQKTIKRTMYSNGSNDGSWIDNCSPENINSEVCSADCNSRPVNSEISKLFCSSSKLSKPFSPNLQSQCLTAEKVELPRKPLTPTLLSVVASAVNGEESDNKENIKVKKRRSYSLNENNNISEVSIADISSIAPWPHSDSICHTHSTSLINITASNTSSQVGTDVTYLVTGDDATRKARILPLTNTEFDMLDQSVKMRFTLTQFNSFIDQLNRYLSGGMKSISRMEMKQAVPELKDSKEHFRLFLFAHGLQLANRLQRTRYNQIDALERTFTLLQQ